MSTGRAFKPSFRTFLWLWGSQTLSLFGSMITTFAINVWLVKDLYPAPEQKAALAVALTVVSIAGFAPLVVAMPIAGAFADRHDRRRILIIANLTLALLTALLVTLTVTGRLTLPLAAALLVLYAIATSFHNASFDSSYGRFVIAAMVAWAITFPPHHEPPAGTQQSLVADVRAGFHWILTRRPFRVLLGMGSLANFMFGPLFVLLPLLARDRVGADATARGMSFEAVFALANVAGGLGGVLGGVLVSMFGLPPIKKSMIMALSIVVLAIGEVLAGLSTTVWGLAVGMFVGELLVAPLNTASFTLWQGVTPQHMLARALSTRRFLAQSAFPLGSALAGWLAVNMEPWIVVTGAGTLLAVGCTATLLQPAFRTLEERLRTEAARPD